MQKPSNAASAGNSASKTATATWTKTTDDESWTAMEQPPPPADTLGRFLRSVPPGADRAAVVYARLPGAFGLV